MKVQHIPPVEPDFTLTIKASEEEFWDLHDILCFASKLQSTRFSVDQARAAKSLASYIDTMLTTWDAK
jgi:hypothetical protein